MAGRLPMRLGDRSVGRRRCGRRQIRPGCRPTVRITIRTSRGASPTAAMPVPLREAEALGLGPGVADHEGRGHGAAAARTAPARRSQPSAQPASDADVDDASPAAIEDRVHERAELATPCRSPGRARRRTGRSTPPTISEDAGDRASSAGRGDRGDDRDPEADQRQGVRRQADPARTRRRSAWRCRGRAGAAQG